MHEALQQLAKGVPWTGDVRSDVSAFLAHHGCLETLEHSLHVAEEAGRLAARFGESPSAARVAGWLHDVSAVVPRERRARVSAQLGLDVLPEEETVPMILHQKLSAALAQGLFGVTDGVLLGAIRCHTTLRAGASRLDKVLFVADKVAWDQQGVPPYLDTITAALYKSLDRAALCYLDHLWQQRHRLPIVHPWFVAARSELTGRLAGDPPA